MPVIKGSLLLSIYEQLWVVQYGEIGRWSLVGIRVGESLSSSNMFFVISWECILQPAIMDQSGGLLLGSHLCYECYRVFLWQKLYCTSSINVFFFLHICCQRSVAHIFLRNSLTVPIFTSSSSVLRATWLSLLAILKIIHFSEFMLIFCS